MRSAIHTTFGEPADVLELGDRQVPQPGAGEVRIKTSLAPIHHHDLWTIRGSRLLTLLRQAAAGADPDVLFVEEYANCIELDDDEEA